MPKYHVKLGQGKRSITEEVEAKSFSALLDFYNYVTTMKVLEIREVVYVASETVIPPHDFMYNSLFKVFAKNDTTKMSRQFIFHNIKKTRDENEIFLKMKECLSVEGAHIDGIFAGLMKE